MLDMGFIRDIKKILAMLPKQRQNLLFSATFSDEIKTLADGLLHNPGFVEVARRNTASEMVEQTVHMVNQAHKRDLMSHLIKHHDWKQVLVFTRTKHGANRLTEKLIKDGIEAAAIHGNKSQGARTKALAQFKDGSMRVLVATDIAARGLDIDQLPQVVNFELPNIPEDYVHRIGRTGRAGASGAAISLVDSEEAKYLRDIEKLIKREIPRVAVEGFVPPTSIEPEAPRAPRPANNAHRQNRSEKTKEANARRSQGQRNSSDNNGRVNLDGRSNERTAGEGRTHAGASAGRTNTNGQRNGRPGNPQGGPNGGANQRPRSPHAANGHVVKEHVHVRTATERTPVEGNVSTKIDKNMSEAARHQSMPQAALFSPKSTYRGNNGGNNGGGNRGR